MMKNGKVINNSTMNIPVDACLAIFVTKMLNQGHQGNHQYHASQIEDVKVRCEVYAGNIWLQLHISTMKAKVLS